MRRVAAQIQERLGARGAEVRLKPAGGQFARLVSVAPIELLSSSCVRLRKQSLLSNGD